MKTPLKRGFEIYYFDGMGSKPVGPLDFNEFMSILGELDADSGPRAGDDTELLQHELPFKEEIVLNRESEESSDTGVS